MKIKPGMVIRQKVKPAWGNKPWTATVLDVNSEEKVAWLKLHSNDDTGGWPSYDTLGLEIIGLTWEEVPQFFKVDKKYKFKGKSFGAADIHQIFEIYEVEKPYNEGDRLTAVGKVTVQGGREYITMYNQSDFDRMEEI